MKGIFGDLFDFDGDGQLDPVEQAADFLLFNEMTKEEDDDDLFADGDDEPV